MVPVASPGNKTVFSLLSLPSSTSGITTSYRGNPNRSLTEPGLFSRSSRCNFYLGGFTKEINVQKVRKTKGVLLMKLKVSEMLQYGY